MIKFVKYAAPKSKLELKVIADASSLSVKGDFLSAPPTLYEATNFLWSVISRFALELHKHNNIKVVEEKDSCLLVVVGVQTGEERKLCGFIKEL